jgi:hypothetical protein
MRPQQSSAIARYILALLAAVAVTTTISARELDGGGWRGRWIDNNSGHEDALRARFRPTRDGNYRVVFSGKFAKVIPFVFATKLNVVERNDGQVILAGTSRIMGISKFIYNAVADEHNFNAQYSSRRWAGEFNLSR